MDRAYALLTIKSVDADRRIITGTATTPTPDRLGDIIEPLGVKYKNPLPLLLFHDATAPVGQVRFDPPTEEGVTFTATLAAISEPGRLKDRVDEAWQSVKAGLLKAVSIGFRLLGDSIEPLRSGGLRYLKTEVLELSLVAIPANQEATIATIKSLDTGRPSASGRPPGVVTHRPGVTGTNSAGRTMPNVEKLNAAKTALKTKTAELEALMNRPDDVVLSEAEREQQKTLTLEVKELTAQVEGFEAIERALGQQAVPVIPRAAEPRSFGQISGPNEPKLEKGVGFARMVRCKLASFKAFQDGHAKSAHDFAREWFPSHPSIALALKAAVDPMTTADGAGVGGTALVYAQNLVSEFVEYLRPMTIIGQFGIGNVPSLRRIPFNVRITGQTSGATAQWVGQGIPKPVQKYNTAATSLTWAKITAIVVLSEELARFSNPSADAMTRDELARAIRERMDRDFVDPMIAAVANVNPASITNGIVALTPSGTDAAAVRADLLQLLTPFITANIPPTSITLITTNIVALTLSLMRNALGQREFPDITMKGGTLEGFPVIASQYCASGSPVSNLLIAAAADEIYLADDGQVTVDVSREASVEMSDDPANEAGTVVSLWQNNLIGLKAERYVNWALRRAAAVAYLDNVAYQSGSPS